MRLLLYVIVIQQSFKACRKQKGGREIWRGDEKGGRKEEGEAVKRGKEEESWRKWGKGTK